MNGRDLASLVHLAGFATGAILYAMLGAMTQRRVANVVTDRPPAIADRLPLIAAFLGVVWNVGAMVVFAVRDFGNGVSLHWLAAISYSALGFLPAVVVHAALPRRSRPVSRWLIGVSYATSSVVAVFHFVAAAHAQPLSRNGLLVLTIVYAGVLAVLAITERRQAGFQRTITAVALAAFAISALHLSGHAETADQGSWWVELIGHHASLPLVLAVLYQEHRFAFSDLFLKRALAILVLVALISVAYASLTPLIDPHAITAQRQAGRRVAHLRHRRAPLRVARHRARISVHSTASVAIRRSGHSPARRLPSPTRRVGTTALDCRRARRRSGRDVQRSGPHLWR